MTDIRDYVSTSRLVTDRRRIGPRVLANSDLIELARTPGIVPYGGDADANAGQQQRSLRPIILAALVLWTSVAMLVFK